MCRVGEQNGGEQSLKVSGRKPMAKAHDRGRKTKRAKPTISGQLLKIIAKIKHNNKKINIEGENEQLKYKKDLIIVQ